MIFVLVLYLFVFIGMYIMIFDWFSFYVLGIPIIPMVAIGLKVTGFMLATIGVVLYHGRTVKTFGSKLTPLPDYRITKCLHLGKSGAKILNGIKCEPNRIRARGEKGQWMNIKDTGKSINLAGHDFTITCQDVSSNLPLQICDAVSKWKEKYGVRNNEEFLELYEQLKGIEKYEDLESISFLKPIMANEDTRKTILRTPLDDLRNMKELLFDGCEIGIKEYLDWSDEATPYDNEALIDSTISQMRSQDQKLDDMRMMDLMKWIIPLVILLIFGAIAYQIFIG